MIKKVITYLLVTVFVVSATYKTFVLIDFCLNRAYIESNLCINRFDKIPVCKGSCYLDKQFKKVDKQEHKFPDFKLKEIQLFISKEYVNEIPNMEIINSNQTLNKLYQNFYRSQNTFRFFHPPKTC
jgi:hypothetical protein